MPFQFRVKDAAWLWIVHRLLWPVPVWLRHTQCRSNLTFNRVIWVCRLDFEKSDLVRFKNYLINVNIKQKNAHNWKPLALTVDCTLMTMTIANILITLTRHNEHSTLPHCSSILRSSPSSWYQPDYKLSSFPVQPKINPTLDSKLAGMKMLRRQKCAKSENTLVHTACTHCSLTQTQNKILTTDAVAKTMQGGWIWLQVRGFVWVWNLNLVWCRGGTQPFVRRLL